MRLRPSPLALALIGCAAAPRPVVAPRAAPPPAPSVAAPEAPRFTALTAGGDFACALRSDGAVWCWGAGAHGQLGDGERHDRAEPEPVPGITDAVRVAAAGESACALTRGGGVRCWGEAIDRRSQGARVDRATPEALPGVDDATDLAVGPYQVCAVRRDGRVPCWGPPPTRGGAVPWELPDVTDATRVAISAFGTVVATRGGPLRFWPLGATGGARSAPYEPGAVRALHAAGHLVLVQRADGAVESWEPGFRAQPPAPLREAEGADLVAAGHGGWCFARGGRARCRAATEDTVEGHGVVGGAADRDVAGLRAVRAVAVGERFACALEGDELRCWGSSERGALADAGAARRPVPAGGAPLTGVRDLAAAGDVVCAIMAEGAVRCWGRDVENRGAFGAGVVGSALPLAREGLRGVAEFAALGRVACATAAGAPLRCFERADDPADEERGVELAEPRADERELATGLRARSVAVTRDAVCAVDDGGAVRCAARGGAALAFEPVAGVEGASRVVGLGGAVCALFEAAAPRCWGRDAPWGLVANAARVVFPSPVERAGLGPTASIAAGEHHACAAGGDGVVRCWGRGREGQLGSGLRSMRAAPTPVPLPGAAAEVAVGDFHSCARLADGTVRCWGANDLGQLGDGTGEDRAGPVAVAGLDRVRRIVAARDHACALRDDRSVWCWGDGVNDSLGCADGGHVVPSPVRAE